MGVELVSDDYTKGRLRGVMQDARRREAAGGREFLTELLFPAVVADAVAMGSFVAGSGEV